MNLAIITSKMRPGGQPDLVIALVETLLKAGHRVAPLVGEFDDPIKAYALAQGWPWLDLYPTLMMPRRDIIAGLRSPEGRAQFAKWLAEFQAFGPELGIAFLTGWVPDEVL